ncbi:MAG: hypothetical protein Q9219_007331 [cf. Caloplaca sp. 3 TL-2023]
MGHFGDLSTQGKVAVGILVGLASTSIQSLGLTLQRKSHILEDKKGPHDPRRPPFRRRRWQLGMFMFIVSNLVGSSIQITTLPLPVLSTLQASGLVFNSICATLILGEPFTRWSLGGTLLVCVGAVLIATFGAISEPAHSLDQLLTLLGRRQFVLWMVATVVIVGALIVGAKVIKWADPRVPQTPLAPGMGFLESEGGSESELSLSDGDEEAFLTASNGGPASPLLQKRSSDSHGITNSCKQGVIETQEILKELEDDTLPNLFSPALLHHRIASANSTKSERFEAGEQNGQQPDESSALLGRTMKSRKYRDQRERRLSEPSMTGSRTRHRHMNTLQEWWKMRWWKGEDTRLKDDNNGHNEAGCSEQ